MKNNKLQFTVEDSGVGIDKKEHEIIFERFRQADSGLRIKKGSGLGLAICKGLVTKMDGSIWVESELGKGTSFSFTIPYKQGIQIDFKKFSPPEKIMWNGFKMLIVEDDPVSLKYLREIVKNTGIVAIMTVSGKEALQKFKEEKDINIVLLDIQLPDMDGYHVLKNMRQINPEIIAIAQTAFVEASEKEKSFKSGFDDFITKPVTPSQLINIINKYLKQ